MARLAPLGLSFDLQTLWWRLDAAHELAADFPDTQVILNHAGLPADRSPDGLRAWERALRRLAERPNVAIEVFGLGQSRRPWTVEAHGPVVMAAIDAFGPDRAMFASNFPVDSLVASFDGFDVIIAGLPGDARAALFRDTARRVYRLPS